MTTTETSNEIYQGLLEEGVNITDLAENIDYSKLAQTENLPDSSLLRYLKDNPYEDPDYKYKQLNYALDVYSRYQILQVLAAAKKFYADGREDSIEFFNIVSPILESFGITLNTQEEVASAANDGDPGKVFSIKIIDHQNGNYTPKINIKIDKYRKDFPIGIIHEVIAAILMADSLIKQKKLDIVPTEMRQIKKETAESLRAIVYLEILIEEPAVRDLLKLPISIDTKEKLIEFSEKSK